MTQIFDTIALGTCISLILGLTFLGLPTFESRGVPLMKQILLVVLVSMAVGLLLLGLQLLVFWLRGA